MFIFCAGTIPLMLGVGVLFNLTKGSFRALLNKVASVLILLFSVMMLLRGVGMLGVNFTVEPKTYDGYVA